MSVQYDNLIAKNSNKSTLDNIATIESGKRPNNIVDNYNVFNHVPVIGASKIMGYTDQMLSDVQCLIIGRVGTHGIVQRFNEEIWPSDNTLIIKSNNYEFVYQVLKRIDYALINRGSTQPLITQTDIKNTSIILPSIKTMKDYEDIVFPITKAIENNEEEIVKLVRIRDVLLPKLMSGEIDVSNLDLSN